MANEIRALARIDSIDFYLGRTVFPMMGCTFEYDSGGMQGLGYSVDVIFIRKFMEVFGRSENGLTTLKGKSCWVTRIDGIIKIIEPLMKKDGKTFDIRKWSEWKEKNPGMSPDEIDKLDFT